MTKLQHWKYYLRNKIEGGYKLGKEEDDFIAYLLKVKCTEYYGVAENEMIYETRIAGLAEKYGIKNRNIMADMFIVAFSPAVSPLRLKRIADETIEWINSHLTVLEKNKKTYFDFCNREDSEENQPVAV